MQSRLEAWLAQVGPARAFSAVLEAADVAAFAVDADRKVVCWTAGAESLLGFTAEQVLGEHCLKANRCRECMVGCGVEDHGRLDAEQLVLHRPDGTPVNLLKTAVAFYADDGTFAGAVEVLRARDTTTAVRPATLAQVESFHGMVTGDDRMQAVFQICRNVAQTDASVLARGESGTGKELVARAIHLESRRRDGPFIVVNCAALSPALLESALFGHKRGAFTGATQDRVGIFERADGGTLFLDEVAELPLDLQAKLLRVLEDGIVVPVGGTRALKVDVRLVAATHRSLRAQVAAGLFRQDLMYRLRVVPIFLPALRERRGDVAVLLWRFIEMNNIKGPRRLEGVSPEAMRALLDHPWPGNARELRNVVEYAFAVGRGPTLLASELPPELRERTIGQRVPVEDPEVIAIRAALTESGGRIGEAAVKLGISRATLWRKRKRLGL